VFWLAASAVHRVLSVRLLYACDERVRWKARSRSWFVKPKMEGFLSDAGGGGLKWKERRERKGEKNKLDNERRLNPVRGGGVHTYACMQA